jgi:hypothetical protein
MPLNGRPLRGPKLPFYAPLPASKRNRNLLDPTDIDYNFCRIVCKDSIGNFLGLPPANYRTGIFKGDAANAGKRFSINEKVGAKPYTLTLKPDTHVIQGKYDWESADGHTTEAVVMKSLQIFMPSHIQVWRVLFWLTNETNYYLDDIGNQIILTAYTPPATLKSIFAVTTPSGRKYNLRSMLCPDAVPFFPSPAPSPSP